MFKVHLEDDTKEQVSSLITERIPWLIVGLLGGIGATIVVSSFEKILSQNIALAFFLPVIVYMSDAIGTQTENIYVRFLSKHKDSFLKYIFKEIIVGICFGIIFGVILGGFAYFWIGSAELATVIGAAMLINASIAPVVALIIPQILFKEHKDPALGAGPFTTIIQDLLSILIYLFVATLIIF